MATHLIGYDLDKPGQNYEALKSAIEELAGGWWHHLDSTWLVTSALTAKEVRDKLKPHLDANDKLLVINVGGDAYAWTGFSAKAGDWLKENL